MKLLVANRGEIALRIFRTAKEQGCTTIAVYSSADANAPHVQVADEAVLIGPPPPLESYLNVPRIIDAALKTGATAIHPGYGFLSENAEFARACVEAGITFVGPSADVIELMGDKSAAKLRMRAAGVPLLDGYNGDDQSHERLIAEAERIGLPLMVKAAFGGGGKGMRLVRSGKDLINSLDAACREAASAFGSGKLILERALLEPRHIEIQVLADSYGHVVALGDRDCSVQRRHQKVVEEAPSPALDDSLRRNMMDAAVRAAEDIGYVGAGTVEFLVDEDGTFAFLEMNTRLQVEHPVTEMTTGIDLVEWQLRIAAGQHLSLRQENIILKGHAIEVRLYAEDQDFIPSAGRIERWISPSDSRVRIDSGICSGYEVSTHYDPMLAKIIAHGDTREEARRRLITALERTAVLGILTNRSFLIEVLRDPRFVSGAFSTAFLTEHTPEVNLATPKQIAGAALALHQERERLAQLRSPGLSGWTNNAEQRTALRVSHGEQIENVVLVRTTEGLAVQVNDVPMEDVPAPSAFWTDNNRVLATFSGVDIELTDVSLAPPVSADEAASGIIRSPFHGMVRMAFVREGDHVQVGDKLIAVEAMKMEHSILAEVNGTVASIIAAGTQVAAQELLVRIEEYGSDA